MKGLVPDTKRCESEEVKNTQLTPHHMWVWNDVNHWKHWHGIWVLWQPFESPSYVKANRCIRSLRADNDERTRLFHRNQWFAVDGSELHGWEYGPWIMEESTHSLPNGILHPNKDDFRMLQFPNGDLGWLQMDIKPNEVMFGEVHFMLPGKDGRAPVIVGYDKQGKMGAALMLEETRSSDEKPDPTWNGDVWDQQKAIQNLEQSREEPNGRFIGHEIILTTELNMIEQQAEWTGFKCGVNKEVEEEYSLVYMPYNFTVFAPKKPAVGKDHALVVHWVVDHRTVRTISWMYGADCKLHYVKSGTYTLV